MTRGSQTMATNKVPLKAVQAKKRAPAAVGSPEKERSAPNRGNGKVGAPARDAAVAPTWAQDGKTLTTETGVPVDNSDNTSKLGARGPALLQDFHLREK